MFKVLSRTSFTLFFDMLFTIFQTFTNLISKIVSFYRNISYNIIAHL